MTKTKKDDKKSESTDLVVLTPEEQAYLDSLKAERNQDDYNGPARLVINTSAKDADGNRRPIGGWHISGTDKYYDGVIRFRPIRHAYKLIRYSQDAAGNFKVVGQSIYFKDFQEEILDSLGTIALGRKFGKAYTDEQKEATKKLAECYLDIFGFVTFGDSEEKHPVLYRTRGTKMMKMNNAFRAVPKDKMFSEYEYKLETFQPEGKQYWDIEVTPDLSQRLPISPILSYDKEVVSFIGESNLAVISSYKKNQNRATEDAVVNSTAKTVSKTAEVDDELPF